ncbi:porin [Corallococcus exiguus]|uniref:porin n=1 Tax=Corallococcus exiguus TaxID=83462 RepID=UPI0014713357|nr:hypothetical protein [Corallococcus exiguus]
MPPILHPPSGRAMPARGLLLTSLLLCGSANAQEADTSPPVDAASPPAAPSLPEPPAATVAEPPPPDDHTGSDVPPPTVRFPAGAGVIEVGGRLSVRETVDSRPDKVWSGRLSLPATRLEATYRFKKKLKAVVEFDVQDGLKDAYAWLDLPHGFAIRAGQFKVPLSLIELESSRSLPLARRGLLRDVLRDALVLTGRRPGAQLEWKCKDCAVDLKLRAGVWQTGNDTGKVDLSKGLGVVPAFRGTLTLGTVELGASALLQPAGSIDGGSHTGWTAGLDVQHELPVGRGALRTWGEVLVGRTELLTGLEGPFLTARALTGWRIGGGARGALFVEPFVMLSALDPDRTLHQDLVWEGAAGLNVGQFRHWRLQAQAEVREAGDAVPAVVTSLEDNLASRKAVLLQMEVSF